MTTPLEVALQLADWRARMARLFDAVRAEADPPSGHALWRRGRDELFASHPQSPLVGLPADDPLRTEGLPVWPYDPALRFTLDVEPAGQGDGEADGPEDREAATGEGVLTMRRVGRLHLPDPVGGSLDVWDLQQYGGGLFVPLRDATAGTETYGAGRYLLDTAKSAWHGGDGRRLVLDLNFAYHPSCRYDPRWTCPLAPPGNRLDARVEAGERLP